MKKLSQFGNDLKSYFQRLLPEITTLNASIIENWVRSRDAIIRKRSGYGLVAPKKRGGFTLLELMVVLAIVAILTTLAVPSLSRMIQINTISSNVNNFMADLRYARSESMRRGGGVVMCRSDSPEAITPVCSTTAGPGSNGWVSGWIIYIDANNDGVVNATDLLRVQAPITTMDSIIQPNAGTSTVFSFTATGRLQTVDSATSLQFGGLLYAKDIQRILCVNPAGRARIAGDGTTTCGTDT